MSFKIRIFDIFLVFLILLISIFSTFDSKQEVDVKIIEINNENPYFIKLELNNEETRNYIIDIVHKKTQNTIYNQEILCENKCIKQINFSNNIFLGEYKIFINVIDNSKILEKQIDFEFKLERDFEVSIDKKFYIQNGKVNLSGEIKNLNSKNINQTYFLKLIPKDTNDKNFKKEFQINCNKTNCKFEKILNSNILIGKYNLFIASSKNLIQKEIIFDYSQNNQFDLNSQKISKLLQTNNNQTQLENNNINSTKTNNSENLNQNKTIIDDFNKFDNFEKEIEQIEKNISKNKNIIDYKKHQNNIIKKENIEKQKIIFEDLKNSTINKLKNISNQTKQINKLNQIEQTNQSNIKNLKIIKTNLEKEIIVDELTINQIQEINTTFEKLKNQTLSISIIEENIDINSTDIKEKHKNSINLTPKIQEISNLQIENIKEIKNSKNITNLKNANQTLEYKNIKDNLKKGQIKPGIYKSEKNNKTNYYSFGLISINTLKPLYTLNEKVTIIFVVLDKYGYPYNKAQIDLQIIDENNQSYNLSTKDSDIVKTSRNGVYIAFFEPEKISKYQLKAKTLIDGIEVDIESYFNVIEQNQIFFDILREVPPTIDPWEGPFLNNFTIKSYIKNIDYNLHEFIPNNFKIYETNADIINNNSNKIELIWFNLSENKNPYYIANSPLETPMLYELGKSYIEYEVQNQKFKFYENRSWMLAIDPAAKICGFDSPCICGASCSGADENSGDGTIDSCTDGNSLWEYVNDIRIINLENNYMGTGNLVEFCVDFDCDTTGLGDKITMGYEYNDGLSGWSNADVIAEWGCKADTLVTKCQNVTLFNHIGNHSFRGKLVWDGYTIFNKRPANRICDNGATYRDHDDLTIEVLEKRGANNLQFYLDNQTHQSNNLSVFRGNLLNIIAQWDRPIIKSLLNFTTSTNFNLTRNYISSFWTNYSLDTSDITTFDKLGENTINFIGVLDKYFEIPTKTTDKLYFNLYGQLEVKDIFMWPYIIYQGTNISAKCQVGDKNVNIFYENQRVNFYNNQTGYLGYSITNQSGWAIFNFTTDTLNVGKYTIICNTTNNKDNFLINSNNNYKTHYLEVKNFGEDIEPPKINSVNISNPSISVGGEIVIYANVTDNINLTNVYLEITSPDNIKYNIIMTQIEKDIYKGRFTSTTKDGLYKYKIYGFDNSTNKGWTNNKFFEVFGVRTYIGIRTAKETYKIGENIVLTPYTKVKNQNTSTYNEQGDITNIFYSFDLSDEGWIATGLNSDWERGIVSSSFSRCDEGNCFSTNLDGDYGANTYQRLNSPILDFSGRKNIKINFWRSLEIFDDSDHNARIETYNGNTWQTQFSETKITGENYILSPSFQTIYPSELDNIENARIRFFLESDSDNLREGWVVDSVNISFSPREDWKNQWHYIDSEFGNFESKITAIEISTIITEYIASGSNTNLNLNPDLEFQIFNGTNYSGSFTCHLDNAKTYPYNCNFVIKNIKEYVKAWENISNRKIRMRAINMDKDDKLVWSNVSRQIVMPSIIENLGLGSATSYLLINFQDKDGNVLKEMNNAPIFIPPKTAVQFNDMWNYTVPPVMSFGNYTAYVALVDANKNVLINEDDNSLIEDAYTFSVESLFINVTSPLPLSAKFKNFVANITFDTTYYGVGGYCGYNLDNIDIADMNKVDNMNYYHNFYNLSYGIHNISFYCNDSDGDMISTPWIPFYVIPDINISISKYNDGNNVKVFFKNRGRWTNFQIFDYIDENIVANNFNPLFDTFFNILGTKLRGEILKWNITIPFNSNFNYSYNYSLLDNAYNKKNYIIGIS